MHVARRRYQAIIWFPFALIGLLAVRAAAQTPTPPGVVTTRAGAAATGNGAQRYHITPMTPTTKAHVRDLIAAYYPSVVRGAPAIGAVTFVLGPNGSYRSSTVRAPSAGDTTAYVRAGAVVLPSTPRSLEYATFAAGDIGPSSLRVVVVNVQ